MSTATALNLEGGRSPRQYKLNVVGVRMVRDATLLHHAKVIRTAADAAAILKKLLADEDREHFVVLCLSTRHEVTAIHTVSIGGLNSAPVHPREVFKAAILANAAAVIIGHNHPSGSSEASRDDVLITEQLKAAGRLLGIEVLDHIIVGTNSFTSLRETRAGFP